MADALEQEFNKLRTDWARSDYGRSIPTLMNLALNGHAKSQRVIATSYQCGWGLERDIKAAIHWFKKATENGDPTSAIALALIFDPSNEVSYAGVDKDEVTANDYYKFAFTKATELSSQRDIDAMDCLADCYLCGWGCDIDLEQGRRWKKLSEQLGADHNSTKEPGSN